jgi:hypothetical protein
MEIFTIRSALASIHRLRNIVERTQMLLLDKVMQTKMDSCAALLGIVIQHKMASHSVEISVSRVPAMESVLDS